MYSVTDTFKSLAANKSALWQRQFTIGGSDYSDDVLKWPEIERHWDEVSPLTVTIELSNEDRMFNFFMLDKALLHNACVIKLGLPIGINLLKYSQEFDNTGGWTAVSCTVTANSTIAPDGTLTADTLTDSNAAVAGYYHQSCTVANDHSTYVASLYVKKTTGGTSKTLGIYWLLSGGTAVGTTTFLDTDTGNTFSSGTVIDAGDYWRVHMSFSNNSSGNTALRMDIYPAISANGTSNWEVTHTGSAIVWGAQLERGTVPAGYTMTTSAAYAPYILMNAADKSANISLNNDVMSSVTASLASARATLGFSSGKWYWEVSVDVAVDGYHVAGIGNASAPTSSYPGADTNGVGYYSENGFAYYDGVGYAYGWPTYTVGDVIGIALDMDAGTMRPYKNGVAQGSPYTGLSGTQYPMTALHGNPTTASQSTANFGRNGFAYGPPAGYSPAYVANVEHITPFSGTVDAIRYKSGKVSLTLVDKFKKLSDRIIADTTTPQSYTGSNYMVHDMAWYVCTSHGGLSAIASTSNPDIDYASFSSWTSIFSADNVRLQAQFTGQKPMEALKKISLLTQSAIWIENDKIKFTRFSLTTSSTATLNDSTIIDAEHVLDDRTLLNKYYVGANYNVSSRSHAITIQENSSSSISRYGLREDNSMENYIWLVDSVSALNLAQRMVNTWSEIKGSYTITTPLQSVVTTIGDTLLFEDSLLQVNDTFRVMSERLDLDAGLKTYTIDQTQIMVGFILDVTSLDGTEILT